MRYTLRRPVISLVTGGLFLSVLLIQWLVDHLPLALAIPIAAVVIGAASVVVWLLIRKLRALEDAAFRWVLDKLGF